MGIDRPTPPEMDREALRKYGILLRSRADATHELLSALPENLPHHAELLTLSTRMKELIMTFAPEDTGGWNF